MICFIKSGKERQILFMRIKDFLLHTQLNSIYRERYCSTNVSFSTGWESTKLLRQICKIFHNLMALKGAFTVQLFIENWYFIIQTADISILDKIRRKIGLFAQLYRDLLIVTNGQLFKGLKYQEGPSLHTQVQSYLLHLKEETHFLKTSHFVPFVELFPNYCLQGSG